MSAPVIVDALRTPIGRFRGGLAGVRPDDLAGIVIREIVARNRVPADEIDDVVFGCANQAGEDNRNVARMGALLAGLPHAVSGVTVNRLCGSGLEAILTAARAIRAGEGELFVAGGVESMTRAPFVIAKSGTPWPNGNLTVYDTSLGWRFPNERMKKLFPLEAMGETAENLAERFGITRNEQDAFALESHRKALAAEKAGRFSDERIAVEALARDEGPREDTTLEALARLKPAFKEGGTVTAGNAPGVNDGAAALLVAAAETVRVHGLKPMARIIGQAVSGLEPSMVMMTPVPAVRKLWEKTGWSARDVDLVELNEAFAVQAVAVMRELGLDPARVNVHGGAVALGHPIGASGARVLTTLLYALRDRGGRRGVATLCLGGGNGVALAVELV
jgi:acetyl-CoA C-acetyltransferase